MQVVCALATLAQCVHQGDDHMNMSVGLAHTLTLFLSTFVHNMLEFV